MNKRFIALLRGINVGGNNVIRMADLKACFEQMGFGRVATHIQSGNLAFDADVDDVGALTQRIELALSERFQYRSVVVVMLQQTLQDIVRQAPPQYGEQPDLWRYDVFFLIRPMTVAEAMECIKPREGVDYVYPGTHAIYFSRLISKAGQSYMTGIIKTKLYPLCTIRNWNTTTRMCTL